MTLRYTNHSPDALPFLWFQTEQNAFRLADTTGTQPRYGDIIESFTQVINGKSVPVTLEDHQAETKATLAKPLRPGETATFHITWHFLVPPRDTNPNAVQGNFLRAILGLRMGRDGTLYRIAQWYPRVNVYDDVKGWNTEPYRGDTEFYLEYGDFTLAVTAPANYIIAATGTLENPNAVLTRTQINRLAQAARSDTIIRIITADELRNGSAHLEKSGMVTWKFSAKNVRDAVFAAAPDFQWDATHWKGILTQAFYRPQAASEWNTAADMARQSAEEYSERWFPYPYPHLTVVEANTSSPVGGGMEYPMISFNSLFLGGQSDRNSTYDLLTHEMGHNWFPMIVGSNERMQEWMDEGMNTFINTFAQARFRHVDQATQATVPTEQALLLPGADSYHQTASILQLLRRDVLGPEVFDKAFRAYIRRWAFKHPIPEDFFRTMSSVAGKNLDWFWREWFYEMPGFDQGIDSVTQQAAGNKTQVTVVYGNHKPGVLPLLVRFTLSDSTTKDVMYPVDVWQANNKRYTVSETFPKPVMKIVLDPDHHLVDEDSANNTWVAK